ncbi:MAG TPA: ATP-binding protein [Candidatus Koribacter sp.]
MQSTDLGSTIDGFDPLAADDREASSSLAIVLEEASKRVVHNILKSYTGYFDLFAELLQNALDAVELRKQRDKSDYQPTIWVGLDVSSGMVRVVDNGVGMNEREFKYCLRPSVRFKKQSELRGHKGVGATFVAYGFSFVKLQSKQKGISLAAILRQGRQWAEDYGGTIPRPKFEATEFNVPELVGEESGTCVEIIAGQSAGERPKNLGWLGAQTAEQWYNVLRIKTPLGGVYLKTPAFRPKVIITVRSAEKNETRHETDRAEYFYPHEIPNLKVQSLRDITSALNAITGDSTTKFTRLAPELKKLDAIWEIWDKEELLKDDSYFSSALDEEQKLLIERHSVIVYACFLRSARIWGELNDDIFRLRKGQRIIQGGLQMASDFMVQGDLSIIPLTSTIGYQANSHVIVHFTDGNPDMGRKVFQPELKTLGEVLAVRAVTTFKRFLQHLKPDTGAQTITPDKDLYEWKKLQESYRDKHPLAFTHGGVSISLVSTPQQEQDVIALFHELIGPGVLRGFRFFGTTQSERYDSLFLMEYEDKDSVSYADDNRLGISRSYVLPYITEPKVLEYKYNFDSLVDDFDKEEKFANQIDLVVAWSAGRRYKSKFFLQSLLVGDEGSSRQIFGSTHQAYATGSQGRPAFEVLMLEDLLNWLRDPAAEEARQKRAYREG